MIFNDPTFFASFNVCKDLKYRMIKIIIGVDISVRLNIIIIHLNK